MADVPGANSKSNSNILTFKITENMRKAGIIEFILKGFDFLIKFKEGGMRSIAFSPKKDTISKIAKRMTLKLSNTINKDIEKSVLGDIENQLIERSDDIFEIPTNEASSHSNDDPENAAKIEFIHEVTKLIGLNNAAGTSYENWQRTVKERYEHLREVTLKEFPEAWPMLEFSIAVKTIINVEGVTLPFMGVILAAPSSLKTTVLQLFRKYPGSFYSDSFTPSSLVSHNSALTEEQLQRVDMLPKMKDKLFLTPELAPIFTAKDDDLQKTLGMITRILDGHGYENDSGAHGHRRYGDTFFVWLGAAVEIQPRVWRLLGTLGHKLYFFRPDIPEKTVGQLKELAKKNDFSRKFGEVENALLDYLKVFDAAPELQKKVIRSDGLVKVSWNNRYSSDQDRTLYCIAQFGNLIAHLRGLVYVTEAKHTIRRNNFKDRTDKNSSNQIEEPNNNSIYVEGQDYDTGLPIVEDPSRAIVLLRNLAVGHAISQGRDSLGLEDIPLIMTIALSTAMIGRVELFDLLLKHNGELTTTKITGELRVSIPTAHRAMREFHALRIADVSTISGYGNAELKITLRQNYEWFLSQEFTTLKNFQLQNNGSEQKNESSYFRIGQDTLENSTELSEVKFNEPTTGHTLKVNSPPESDRKNIDGYVDCDNADDCEHDSEPDPDSIISYQDVRYSGSESENNKESEVPLSSNNADNGQLKSEVKNNESLWGSKQFQHVTVTQSHADSNDDFRFTLDKILEVIRGANGSEIAFNFVVESVYSQNDRIKLHLGEKLTPRENKRVRNLALEIIRNKNIEVIKYKPLLSVKWANSEKLNCNSKFLT